MITCDVFLFKSLKFCCCKLDNLIVVPKSRFLNEKRGLKNYNKHKNFDQSFVYLKKPKTKQKNCGSLRCIMFSR